MFGKWAMTAIPGYSGNKKMRNEEIEIRNKEESPVFTLLFVICYLLFAVLFSSCDYGQIGGADQTGTYFPGDEVFEERMNFLCGVWYSHYPGMGWLDGYRIHRWNVLTDADKNEIQRLYPDLDIEKLKTYKSETSPKSGDYILLYGGGFMGLVRAINLFNGDKDRGAIIIEYFEGTAPSWLSGTQGLAPGEKPFFGIYYRVLSPNIVQMANAVDLAALYAGKRYYTEKTTLEEAIAANSVENEAEFISWGVVIPQDREQ
jgi:hypothetical protein